MSETTTLVGLSAEEKTKMFAFIGKCVCENRQFRLGASLKTSMPLNIQDIYNLNVASLREIGKTLKKVINDFDSEFTSSTKPLIGDVPAEDVLEVVKFMIRDRLHTKALEDKKETIKELKAELESLATPEERRLKLTAQLAALEVGV